MKAISYLVAKICHHKSQTPSDIYRQECLISIYYRSKMPIILHSGQFYTLFKVNYFPKSKEGRSFFLVALQIAV